MTVFGAIAVLMLGGLVSLVITESQAETQKYQAAQAFEIAEAGMNYYRWHLAHAPKDYQDGTNGAGPYVHSYVDQTGTTVGQFSLMITPPVLGTSTVTVDSTGSLVARPQLTRTVRARFAIPSFAKYAIVTNDNIRYGSTTQTYGLIHSNGGTRFDGIAHNLVTSAKTTYVDPATGETKPGVWTTRNPASSAFLAGSSFPVPAVDFTGIATTLATIKTKAQASGLYFAPSGSFGYHIVLGSNGTFTIKKVNKLVNKCSNKADPPWTPNPGNESDVAGSPFVYPANGLIFVEDDTWVDGSLNNTRLTIAAAYFPSSPSTDKNIIINNSITYAHTDGSEVLGLIAQKNIILGLYAMDSLTIDAAVIAASGKFYRPDYAYQSCSPYDLLTQLTTYGMIASYYQPYVYSCNNQNCGGYLARTYNYDANLLYNPPPEFPLTTDQYSLIDWREILP